MTDLDAVLSRMVANGHRDQRFWNDDLEMSVGDTLRPFLEEEGILEKWISKRTGYQIAILCRQFGIDGELSVQKQRPALLGLGEALLPYVLVAGFGKGRSKVAITGVATGKPLSEDLLALCRKGTRRRAAETEDEDEDGEGDPDGNADGDADQGEGEQDFDSLALLFALYKVDANLLRDVFHSDKVQKTGFARMTLLTQARRPAHSLEKVLRRDVLKKLLKDFDEKKNDGRPTDLRGVVSYEGRFLVFIRRPERPEHILDDGHIRHGYFPEWIVLDFEEGAKRVKISSRSNDVPLEIANRIASAYFDKHCEYANEKAITHTAQIRRFLSTLTAAPTEKLALVEILLGLSPLEGAPKLKISATGGASVGPAITDFGAKVGGLLDAVEAIESVKVEYRRKRVSLILEAEEGKSGEYVVRYSDHRLNGYERSPFEDHMREVHGIDVLSTEKRTKRGRK